MPHDFDRWNDIKKWTEFEKEPPILFPREREVWMCSIGQNIGFEQHGMGQSFGRPVLVIKKFNNKMFWAAPLSSKQKAFDFYHNFTDPEGRRVAVILAQLRLISVKRFDRNMYTIPQRVLDGVRRKLTGFLRSKPRTRRGFSEPEGTL